MDKKIWVLGSSNIDITYKVKNIPSKGETIQCESCIKATGGKGANQAVATAHWGANVNFIGAVGNDENGRILLDVLKKHDIEITHVVTVDKIPSGHAIIHVDSFGANCITTYSGANNYVPLNPSVPFNFDDMLVAQLETNMDAVEFYFSLAKKKGVYTVLNPSPFKNLTKQIITNTDLIVLNQSEAYQIAGIEISEPESAEICANEIIKKGPQSVVITLGKMGAVLVKKEKSIHIPEFQVDAVDTQGAGDAFLGTLVSKIYQKVPVEEAVEFANRAASLSVTKCGSTQASMPSIQEMQDTMPQEPPGQ